MVPAQRDQIAVLVDLVGVADSPTLDLPRDLGGPDLEIQRIVNLVGGVVIGMSYAAADRGRDGMPLRTRKRRPGTSPTGP